MLASIVAKLLRTVLSGLSGHDSMLANVSYVARMLRMIRGCIFTVGTSSS